MCLLNQVAESPQCFDDVQAEIETCPNGEKRISEINIGGWLYEVEGDCSDSHRRTRIPATATKGEIVEETPGEAAMLCDPTTWRCRMMAR
ncbi:MAG: hypothetical protein QGG54_02170 [Gammaproteobacteria bacterium]|jgi:hypothetical protein|nr:hypothetical protein [Gammaproteobacteria bacterium]MDP6673848.1 hypothetical protein [Gammaproteobacteria bacterium]